MSLDYNVEKLDGSSNNYNLNLFDDKFLRRCATMSIAQLNFHFN